MSTGIGKCLSDVLRGDITSGTASAVSAQYPLLYPSASGVPQYLYMSLRDIWLTGTGIANSEWSNRVVDAYGLGLGGNRVIYVTPYRIFDGANAPESMPRSNEYGAEFCELFIYMSIGSKIEAADVDRITQTELRIRRLIDFNYANNILGNFHIPVTEATINPNSPIMCYWQGILRDPTPQRDMAIQYYTTYTRILR